MILIYHFDYIAWSGYFRLSVYKWGIFLAYIRRRFSSRLRFHVFWKAGRDISSLKELPEMVSPELENGEKVTIPVEYEWIPPLCKKCSSFGTQKSNVLLLKSGGKQRRKYKVRKIAMLIQKKLRLLLISIRQEKHNK